MLTNPIRLVQSRNLCLIFILMKFNFLKNQINNKWVTIQWLTKKSNNKLCKKRFKKRVLVVNKSSNEKLINFQLDNINFDFQFLIFNLFM